MNEKELRELDAWIAEHVMGWKAPLGYRDLRADGFQPTQSSSDAMQVLKKCAENTWNVFLRTTSDGMHTVGYIGTDKLELAVFAEASTLELAICLFAKKLFSKQNPHHESPTCHCDLTRKTNHP